MKKALIALLTLALSSPIHAGDFAKLSVKISDPVKENKYFLCLYGIGCLSIRAGNRGKEFPVMPTTDIGNIQKMVVTDVSNMSMHMQASDKSCAVVVNKNQHLTISGQLVVKNSVPYIQNLHCHLA
jgi:hypothetical protein